MRKPLDYLLIRALKRGVESTNEDARNLIISFVKGQMTEEHSFKNRGGKGDLYYTMFGWMLCYVLNIDTDNAKRKAYLARMKTEELDALHKTVIEQCEMVDKLLEGGLWRAAIGNWRRRHRIERFFGQFVKHTIGRSVNGEAARLLVGSDATKSHRAVVEREEKKDALEYIRGMQDETGGFLANEGAAMPDLLTTAVALFTLKMFDTKPRYDALNFIDIHFNDDGSFIPNIIDEQSDVEYMFYGLLALGSC